MAMIDDLCDALARDTIIAMDRTGDHTLVEKVGRVLAATSSTTEEVFLTSVKVILSERRARKFLADVQAGKQVVLPPAIQSGGH